MSLNLAPLERQLQRAFGLTIRELAHETRNAFDDDRWQWGGMTRRQNGTVVGSPRDLVDTGLLRDSQQAPEIVGLKARLTWGSPYAAAVFLGATFADRRRSFPARNLPMQVAQEVDLPERFLRHLGAK